MSAQSEWNKRNPGTSRTASAKYRAAHPEYMKRHNTKPRRHYLKRYRLTEHEFKAMLERQHNCCLGCCRSFNDVKVNVDHDHLTQKVRGLLCQGCNAALGLLKEDKATLTRLRAYLDYDRTLKHVYLIGALKNKRIPIIGNLLRARGLDVMDEWFTPGPEADTNWQKYETLRGRTYQQALKGRAATNIFLFDRSYLDLSDIAILVMPAGKSAMLELGYAKGRGKQAWIFLDGQEPERYDIMPGFADRIIKTEEELINAI